MSRLPKIPIECCAEADYDEGANNVERTPTITDRLLEVCRESDGFYLLLARGRGEATHDNHEDDEEHQ